MYPLLYLNKNSYKIARSEWLVSTTNPSKNFLHYACLVKPTSVKNTAFLLAMPINCTPMCLLVSSPDTALKEGKGPGTYQAFLGACCSTSCDCHDNALFWHGNTSTAESHAGAAIVGYSVVSHDSHMQATWCELNWHISIWALRCICVHTQVCTRPFSSLRAGLRTRLIGFSGSLSVCLSVLLADWACACLNALMNRKQSSNKVRVRSTWKGSQEWECLLQHHSKRARLRRQW